MINEQYKRMLEGKSVIRQLSEFATERGKEIGYENVFDYSLGNPSVPVPGEFTEAMIKLLKTKDSMELHGYSPSLGIASVKEKIADSLNQRFGMNYTGNHIFPTTGAAGAVAHAVRCVTEPGDEVLTIAPYFPEYNMYVNMTGARLKVVPADTESFQIQFDKLEEMLTEKVAALLINTPNNPSGAVYSEDTLKKLAELLMRKQKEYGHDIFLISDEPYREIVFDGKKAPYVSRFYDNTLSCYSYSKSLSLPGERIGYVLIPDEVEDSREVIQAAVIANRVSGSVNAPSLIQRVIKRCVHERANIEAYEKNRNLLYSSLVKFGFSCIKPEGAFYLFVKSPAADEKAFCEICKKHNVLVVPGSSFACAGYVRISYCVSYEQIERSLPAFEKIAGECGLCKR